MSTETYAVAPRGRATPRAEYLLAGLAVLSLVLIPIHLTTIYSGLPAHPLFLHVPVILIPVVVIGALVFGARPQWLTRYGVALAVLSVVALAALFLTMGSGSALRTALHLNRGGFGDSALVARHAHAADILRLLTIAFTGVLLVTVLAHRVAGGMPTGHSGADGLLSRSGVRGALRVVLAVLALACGYFVFHTGDLGAKAVWQSRLHRGAGGPGGFPGFPGGPGGGAGGRGAP